MTASSFSERRTSDNPPSAGHNRTLRLPERGTGRQDVIHDQEVLAVEPTASHEREVLVEAPFGDAETHLITTDAELSEDVARNDASVGKEQPDGAEAALAPGH